MGYIFASVSTWVTPTVQVHRGEVWDSDDPIVREHPQWFTTDPSAFVRRSGTHVVTAANAQDMRVHPGPVVEQATRAPGEKRVVKRD